MRENRQRSNPAAAAAKALTVLALCLLAPSAARAQWTPPDAGGHITNTNPGNVKIGGGTAAPTAVVHAKGNLSSPLTGTVAVTQNSAAVTGAGTAFNTELSVGDSIKIGSEVFTVSAVPSATSLTLDSNYLGASASALAAYRDPNLLAVDNGDGVSKLSVSRAGRVGVGTAAPNYTLEVSGSRSRNTLGITGAGDSAGYAGIRIQAQDGASIISNRAAGYVLSMRKDNWYSGDNTSPSFIIEATSYGGGFIAPIMITPQNHVILNGGKGAGGPAGSALSYGWVGVGTVAPENHLHVHGSTLGTVRVSGQSGALMNFHAGGAPADAKLYQWRAEGGLFRMALVNDVQDNFVQQNILVANSAGNVGFGVASPAARLHVGGGARLDGTSGRVYLGAVAVQGARGLEFVEESAMTFSIRHHDPNVAWQNIALNPHGGKVGVGTAAPAVKLAVGGSGVNVIETDAWVERNLHVQGPETLAQGGRGRLRVGSAWGYAGLYADASSSGASNDLVLGAGSGTVRVGPGGSVAQSLSIPNGNITASGTITGGTITADNFVAKYQDVAEWVPSVQKLAPGTVVILDGDRTNHVLASSAAYDTKVAGVVSAEPGVILGVAGDDKVKVATTGRVKVKVDASRSPIKVGDLLVTSGVEGVAMKSVPIDLSGTQIHRPGTIIGKALEPLEKGVGEILVLLSLQ